ncbi:putative C6 transcription factor [Aspergillus ochraceoroseus]|nr:putative C6 transcription factor [Aspergillus ochraceoroseus]
MEIRRSSRGGNVSDRTYQRTYKACIPCRARKAKCDLGELPDGSPIGPPCAKCRREHRQCVFSENRAWERKKKRQSREDFTSPPRTRLRLSTNTSRHNGQDGQQSQVRDSLPANDYGERDEGNAGLHQLHSSEGRQTRHQSTSTLDNSMMRTVVSSGNDALNILFEAAAAHSQEAGLNGSESRPRSTQNNIICDGSNESSLGQMHSVVSPEVLAKASRPVQLSYAAKEVLSIWNACRFVKMGWFTSREAVTLIDLSLHFPPENDGWDSDLVSKPLEPRDDDNLSSNRWLEDMIEPARRSDQMSWMLLGAALSLAHELGIFEVDDEKWNCLTGYEGFTSGDQIKLRRQRVQRLLYVYINQLAWRIGCVSLMPQSLNHTILNRQTARNLKQSGDEWLAFMDSWMDLTKLAKSVTDMFFPSVTFARQQLHSGRYIDLLDHFRPLLVKWKEEHLQSQVLEKPFYDILFIEYHFVRAYTHSIGMQAVVERVFSDSDPNVEEARATNVDPIDYEYIQEVIDGCCQILQKVTELGEAGALKFSPVRIFLRITSSSIFLMKALSLGSRQAKLRESLEILERSIQTLKCNALDDIHLSTRYAALLEMHVSRLRRNLLASSKSLKNNHSYGSTTRSSMVPLPNTDNDEGNTPTMEVPAPQTVPDLGFIPSFNDIGADDWLSLPFDPSMAPFGISSGGQFPAFEGGGLNFIWNLPD